MASERELQATRKSAQEREEEVAQARRAPSETAKKSIEQHEADFAALKEHVDGEEKAARSKIAELDAQIADERKLREVAAARVRPDVLKKYSAIRMRRGLAMVPVNNGTCQGCNMNIPPQVFNQLQRGDSIELCGNCNRIIYWDKMMENPDGAPPNAGKDQSPPSRSLVALRAPRNVGSSSSERVRWSLAAQAARGKSGLHRAGCWLTASRGDPKESATENKPPRKGGKGETVR